jgi:hypothetical protein
MTLPTLPPGLRTFTSAPFRTVLAAVLLIAGVALIALMLERQAASPAGQFGVDFADYLRAAERLSAGEAIYPEALLDGPADAQGVDRYRYPPLLAQILVPVTGAPRAIVELAWLLVQAAAVVAALWVGTGIGGARPTLERALWCGVAAAYFLPVFDTLWKGNVSGFVALTSIAVALGGVAGGVGAAIGTLLKTAPVTLLPAALVADRRARWSAIATLAIGIAISAALAPQAWLDYPRVLANMLQGSADYASNLAPAAVARNLGAPDAAATIVRLAALAVAAASIVLSVILARRHSGLPAAALLGVIAMLLMPGSLWYHYLVALLPFAAVAWVRTGAGPRALLLGGAVAITVGVAWLPAALGGAVVLASTSLGTLWPGRQGHPQP